MHTFTLNWSHSYSMYYVRNFRRLEQSYNLHLSPFWIGAVIINHSWFYRWSFVLIAYFIVVCISSYLTSFRTDAYTYLCVSMTLINGKWKDKVEMKNNSIWILSSNVWYFYTALCELMSHDIKWASWRQVGSA